MPNGVDGGGCVKGDRGFTGDPGAADVMLGSDSVGDPVSYPPPKPSPPCVSTDGIFLPEIFWNPRSLPLDTSVLSVFVVMVDCLHRFINAGAKYVAVKSESGRDAIPADPPPPAIFPPAPAPALSVDGRAC